MKFCINPKYTYLETEIREIPAHRYPVEKVFCNHRNIVELTTIGGSRLVVKKFKRPTWANCVIYTWFRQPKTRRAYNNARLLQSLGVGTAEPVAYIERKKFGFFHTGWFISRYLPCQNVRQVYESIADAEEQKRFADAFIRFTVSLFQKNIYYDDYNADNILARRVGDHYEFSLVDINRLKIRRVPTHQQICVLTQLQLSAEEATKVLAEYSQIEQKSFDDTAFQYLLIRKMAHVRSSIKNWFKRVTGITRRRQAAQAKRDRRKNILFSAA